MFSFPLGGRYLVLGAQWLHTLGPIWMQFSISRKKHTLKGLQPGFVSIISSHRMENILKKDSHGVIAQLHFIHMQPLGVSTTPLDLQQILDRYACVFAEPVGFPTSILEDHCFPLLHGSAPPNINPYRNMFHQKT